MSKNLYLSTIYTRYIIFQEVTYANLYCPTGGSKSFRLTGSDLISSNGIQNKFDKACQCKHGATCKKTLSDSRFFCDSFIGSHLEDVYNVKLACVLHDICYESGRSQSSCDNEFHHNFKELCTDPTTSGGNIALSVFQCAFFPPACPAVIATNSLRNCASMADIVYYAVRDHATCCRPNTCIFNWCT